ncbi:chromosome segregation protein SMC [Scatolibacter rhodanostii]|uniref:chromosome segregation protein SMC n=1 Tax=Scatolibacter rhodanostii TaxID=2014781 RepID=UPI000C086654|nr:chromosome segregation protein SMC [Scatolibacter rhodanostii]
MLLKSLELQGFKTFPDKTKLTFEEGITSVVGPNGSGKSNISDAVRWVLGEQSVRVLRCAKMEDVIFSGTPKRKAQGYAEVTLNIENKSRRLPFDNDNVAITRRYYRSGESEYLVNKTMVRLKDINELFMDTGLGRDGYSIIGQGKIDSIVGAKSEDRREIFEEASGISRFRYRKEESERRLKKAEENLVRLRDILTELEDRVEPLRIQAEKAEQFIQWDAEKKELEIGLWVETIDRSTKVLREHTEKIAVTENQFAEIVSRLEELEESIEQHTNEMNFCHAKMEEERTMASQLDEKALRTEGEISVFENDTHHAEENIERLKSQIELTENSEQDIQNEIAVKREQIRLKLAEVEASRQQLDSFNQKMTALRENADNSTKEIEKTAQELARLHAEAAEEKIKQSSALSSVQEVELRAGAVDENIAQNAEKTATLSVEVQELTAMLAENELAADRTRNALKGHELRVNSRRQKLETVKAECDKRMLDASEQERRAKLLADLEKNLEGFAQSVKAVMKESERGILKGVHGPVTKLIHVQKEYAVALETALGAAMQNIVVETEGDAKAAIRFLKQKGIGRATFLPRTVIKGNRANPAEVSSMPGFVGVATELCECDKPFEGIRDSLLGRVLVAEDLDSAVEIAKRIQYRYRIVSLDGQVVNAGGSLTGGANVRNSGLLSRNAEIERITQKAKELREQVLQAQQDYQQKQQDFAACQADWESAKAELVSLQEEHIKIASEQNRATRDLEQLKLDCQNLLSEKENAGGRLATLHLIAETAATEIAKIEKQLQTLQEESEKLSHSREEFQQRSEDISAAIQQIKLGEMSALKDKEALEETVEQLKLRKNQSGSAVVALQEEIRLTEEKITEIQELIEQKKQETQDLREQAQIKRVSVAEILSKRAELERQLSQLRQEEKSASSQRENVGQELARLQERKSNLQNEYDSVVRKLWEEYELTKREAEELGAKIEDISKAQIRLQQLKSNIKSLGAVNVAAVVEYKEVAERYTFLKEQVTDVETSKAELLKLIGDLIRQMQEQFAVRFAEINRNFGQIFKELFGGGSAQLSFTDESDILNSGIEIKVHPPGKIVTHIESLSGGEKALVAISIYFAIMKVSPPPFCVLDEIEAALDDVNVSRFAQYLRRMSANTQFITITHRRGTMEGSDMLYGVTMQDQGISKLLSLKTDADLDTYAG